MRNPPWVSRFRGGPDFEKCRGGISRELVGADRRSGIDGTRDFEIRTRGDSARFRRCADSGDLAWDFVVGRDVAVCGLQDSSCGDSE